MAYLGSKPSSGFITTAKQRITSSTNNYVDLDNSISSLADVIVWVNSVKQDSTNLTLTTSTRITLGGTLTASDVVEIAYLGKAVATQTPDTGTVTNDMLAGSIANSKLANSSITLNGSAVSLGGSTTISSETNKPCFYAYMSNSQAVGDNTNTKVAFNTVEFQTSGVYDTTNYRFTPSVAGYYQFNIGTCGDADSNSGLQSMNLYLFKNNSGTGHKGEIAVDYEGNLVRKGYCYLSIPIYSDADDYFEVYMQVNDDGGGTRYVNRTGSFFSAFKITETP